MEGDGDGGRLLGALDLGGGEGRENPLGSFNPYGHTVEFLDQLADGGRDAVHQPLDGSLHGHGSVSQTRRQVGVGSAGASDESGVAVTDLRPGGRHAQRGDGEKVEGTTIGPGGGGTDPDHQREGGVCDQGEKLVEEIGLCHHPP